MENEGNTGRTRGRTSRVEMEEEKPCPDWDITKIKNEDLWVRRWSRFHKVAVRSKFG
ncbi:hypothetical protein A2U01_0105203, partial [Trifolium medium]|nr:hypothetical protein [Trifolium medium]